MARPKSAAPDQETPAEAEGTLQQISPRKLKKLLKEVKQSSEDAHEITSSIGGKISDAVTNDCLHKKAFATLRAMDKMTPEKLNDYWVTLQYYVRESGLEQRAASAPRLGLDEAGDNVEHLSDHREPAEAAE